MHVVIALWPSWQTDIALYLTTYQVPDMPLTLLMPSMLRPTTNFFCTLTLVYIHVTMQTSERYTTCTSLTGAISELF